eukprot:2175312-Alexandrium_andersonii.AAC.1
MLLTWKPRRCSFESSAGVGDCTFASRAFVGAGVEHTALAMVVPKSVCWSNGAIDPVHSSRPNRPVGKSAGDKPLDLPLPFQWSIIRPPGQLSTGSLWPTASARVR